MQISDDLLWDDFYCSLCSALSYSTSRIGTPSSPGGTDNTITPIELVPSWDEYVPRVLSAFSLSLPVLYDVERVQIARIKMRERRIPDKKVKNN